MRSRENETKIDAMQVRLDAIEELLACKHQEYDEKVLESQKRLDAVEELLACKHQEYDEKVLESQKRLDNIENQIQIMKKNINRMMEVIESQQDNEKVDLKLNMLNKRTYSQAGEDAIIMYILANLHIPFEECSYLDLGANFPIEGSNSYMLSTQGAKGILVEANPDLIGDLMEKREGDVVLNRCIDAESGHSVTFYIMSDAGLSTPDMKQVEEIQKVNPNVTLKYSKDVETISINDIFSEYFHGEAPTVCSIDIEGKEMEILRSIDMKKYRPLLYIVEMIEYSTTLVVGEKRQEILDYMRENGYEEYAFTGINSIFIDSQQLDR